MFQGVTWGFFNILKAQIKSQGVNILEGRECYKAASAVAASQCTIKAFHNIWAFLLHYQIATVYGHLIMDFYWLDLQIIIYVKPKIQVLILSNIEIYCTYNNIHFNLIYNQISGSIS